MDERLVSEIKTFLGAEYPESGDKKAIKDKLKEIAPGYWDNVDPVHIPPGQGRKAATLLRAMKYGYDPVYGYNAEARKARFR